MARQSDSPAERAVAARRHKTPRYMGYQSTHEKNEVHQYSVQGIGRFVGSRRGGNQGKAARGKGNVGSHGMPTRGGWSGPW